MIQKILCLCTKTFLRYRADACTRLRITDYGNGIRLLSTAINRELIGKSLDWIDPAIKTVFGSVDGK